jgi:hypothetical protein
MFCDINVVIFQIWYATMFDMGEDMATNLKSNAERIAGSITDVGIFHK